MKSIGVYKRRIVAWSANLWRKRTPLSKETWYNFKAMHVMCIYIMRKLSRPNVGLAKAPYNFTSCRVAFAARRVRETASSHRLTR